VSGGAAVANASPHGAQLGLIGVLPRGIPYVKVVSEMNEGSTKGALEPHWRVRRHRVHHNAGTNLYIDTSGWGWLIGVFHSYVITTHFQRGNFPFTIIACIYL
jgi:hypothetical protein